MGVVEKAYGACEKLIKEGMKLSKEGALKDRAALMKEAYTTLNKHLRDLDHVKAWEELPGESALTKASLDSFLGDIAASVKKYNTEIEAAKGALKALKN